MRITENVTMLEKIYHGMYIVVLVSCVHAVCLSDPGSERTQNCRPYCGGEYDGNHGNGYDCGSFFIVKRGIFD